MDGNTHPLAVIGLLLVLLATACGRRGPAPAPTASPARTPSAASTVEPVATEDASIAAEATQAASPLVVTHTPTPRPVLPGLDPCSLISPADAQQVLGENAKAPLRTDVGEVRTCALESVGGSKLITIDAIVGSSARSRFEQERQTATTAQGATIQDLEGIGDAAYTDGVRLVVLKGDVTYSVTYLGGMELHSPQLLDAEEKLARAALQRL